MLCNFVTGHPIAAISRLGLERSGLSVGLSQVVESSPSGLVAIAYGSAANWTATNLSNEERFDLSYSAHVPLSRAHGPPRVSPPPPIGTVDLRLDFLLAAYAGSSAGTMTTVAVELQISNWTWQAPGDHLAVTFGLWPTVNATERLTTSGSGASSVSSVSNSTGRVLEYLQAGGTANVSSPSPTTVPAMANLSLDPTLAQLTIGFGSGAGPFRSLTYVSHVGIVLPNAILGIPTYQFAIAGIAGLGATGAVAIGVRRIRRKPSDLEFLPGDP